MMIAIMRTLSLIDQPGRDLDHELAPDHALDLLLNPVLGLALAQGIQGMVHVVLGLIRKLDSNKMTLKHKSIP